MKSLPYFRWYPADAETDEFYSSLTDAELGFFHRCLNKAWINNGLPAELDKLAAVMGRTRREVEKMWPKVSLGWFERDGRLFNRRQQEERTHATSKSESATRAVRSRYERPTNVATNVARTIYHARYDSVSEEVKKTTLPKRAAEFAAAYPDQSNAQRTTQQYLSVVNPSDEDAVFACLARYKASKRVADGYVQPGWKWLQEQSDNEWAGQWQERERSPYEGVETV